MQKLINKMNPEGIDEVIYNLKNDFENLLTDVYGNYFCQKLIQISSSEQRVNILKCVNFP
jgi:hypothetical protein